MNFSLLLLDFLKKNGPATLSGFGTFFLNDINATLDQEEKSILPPSTEIAFETNNIGTSETFLNYIASEQNISKDAAQVLIQKQITYWNSVLEKDHQLVLEALGTFYLEDSRLHFSGNRLENVSPDFFGLEEINIAQIKKSSKATNSNFSFTKTALWLVPLLSIASAIAFYATTQPEKIFGAKSVLKENSKKDSLKPIIQPVKTELFSDTLKADTLKKVAAPVTNIKKWTSKSYRKPQWKKRKKRQNR